MSDPTLVRPLRYDPSFEKVEKGEAAMAAELARTFAAMAHTMAEHTGHARRAVHAKGHGLLRGELSVLEGLPPQLAQGIFAAPASYPVLLRLSAPPSEELPDDVSTPRGLALKIIGVPGERLPGSGSDTTQNFVMVDSPTFASASIASVLAGTKLLALTTDRLLGAKRLLSTLLRGAEKAVEAVGGESLTLEGLGGHALTHPLGETFFTQLPHLYGDHMAKLSLAPVSPALAALTGTQLPNADRPDALREAVVAFFADAGAPAQSALWELRVQLCTDIEKMPIEDAAVAWPEDLSPYLAVARIKVPPQPAWTDARVRAMEDSMSFSPWHGVASHRPLGALMRVRRPVYEASSNFRAQRNRCPIHEPWGVDSFPPD